jgi:hypothetical protein
MPSSNHGHDAFLAQLDTLVRILTRVFDCGRSLQRVCSKPKYVRILPDALAVGTWEMEKHEAEATA